VSFFLFIIFVVYTMLPFNMRDAIIASVLTSSSHTIVLSVYLSAAPGAKEHLSWQVEERWTVIETEYRARRRDKLVNILALPSSSSWNSFIKSKHR
ncbi:hypothetical protein STEG23_037933, partial [Scotinomys teguina]